MFLMKFYIWKFQNPEPFYITRSYVKINGVTIYCNIRKPGRRKFMVI